MAEIVYEGRDLEVLADMANYYAWIMETFGPHVSGNAVEYGAGTGNFSQHFVPLADRVTLVEPSGGVSVELRSRFSGLPKVTVVESSLETHVRQAEAESFDTILMVNVLEHIEDDRAALANLFRILKPGGRLLIFVPALQALMSKLDRVHGHYRRYHRGDLVAKITESGGEVEHCRYFDLAGTLPWLLLNKLMGSTAFNPTLVGFHDRMVVPLSRTIERMIPVPFGKNLIAVSRKP